MDSSKFDDPQFLEPAHRHDPTKISHIAAIPNEIVERLPEEAQSSLSVIQESTSVAFASHTRLQALVRERFHRLVPSKDQDEAVNGINYSEPAFFNYINQLLAEKEYLLEEAIPDWRHKSYRVDFAGCHDAVFEICESDEERDLNSESKAKPKPKPKTTTLQKWWADLQSVVDEWLEMAEDTEIPDFDETVAEYKLFQAKEIRKNLARNEESPEEDDAGSREAGLHWIEVGEDGLWRRTVKNSKCLFSL